MKKIATLVIGFLLSYSLHAQHNEVAPSPDAPYLRFPTVPPFKLLGVDSSTVYSKDNLQKNRPVLLMVFSPGCEHCKYETEQMVRRVDDFKRIQVVMASTAPLPEIRQFYDQYKLGNFPGLLVGRDYQALLPGFYMLHNLPFHALYSKKGKLLTTFAGSVTVENILTALD